jgi:hypothetical protein
MLGEHHVFAARMRNPTDPGRGVRTGRVLFECDSSTVRRVTAQRKPSNSSARPAYEHAHWPPPLPGRPSHGDGPELFEQFVDFLDAHKARAFDKRLMPSVPTSRETALPLKPV